MESSLARSNLDDFPRQRAVEILLSRYVATVTEKWPGRNSMIFRRNLTSESYSAALFKSPVVQNWVACEKMAAVGTNVHILRRFYEFCGKRQTIQS